MQNLPSSPQPISQTLRNKSGAAVTRAEVKAATPKENFIKKLANTKTRVEHGLEAVGSNISANVKQGQSDFESGRAKYYATINPLKGARTAFKRGYGQ